MKKLFIINLLIAFLLLSGCTVPTPIEVVQVPIEVVQTPIKSTEDNSDSPPDEVCREITITVTSTHRTGNFSKSGTSEVCKKTTDLVDSSDMHDLVINIEDCNINDYEINVLGKTTNDYKEINHRILGLELPGPSRGISQGEMEECISLDNGNISSNLYFKIKNCDTLFNCSLTITSNNNELAIGPFANAYEILYLTNKRGIEISQSNMPGVAVATTEKLHKIRIGQRYYLSNTLNPSDRLIQSLEEL